MKRYLTINLLVMFFLVIPSSLTYANDYRHWDMIEAKENKNNVLWVGRVQQKVDKGVYFKVVRTVSGLVTREKEHVVFVHIKNSIYQNIRSGEQILLLAEVGDDNKFSYLDHAKVEIVDDTKVKIDYTEQSDKYVEWYVNTGIDPFDEEFYNVDLDTYNYDQYSEEFIAPSKERFIRSNYIIFVGIVIFIILCFIGLAWKRFRR